MLWNGAALTTKEDFAEAMIALKDETEAKRFRAIFAEAFSQAPDTVLGYLTRDCHPDHQLRVERLLGVTYPFAGMAYTKALLSLQAHPALAAWIESVPRRDWSLRWKDRQ